MKIFSQNVRYPYTMAVRLSHLSVDQSIFVLRKQKTSGSMQAFHAAAKWKRVPQLRGFNEIVISAPIQLFIFASQNKLVSSRLLIYGSQVRALGIQQKKP